MKYRTLAATLAAATLILAACGNQDENKQSKKEDTKQTQSSNDQTKKESKTSETQTQSNDHSSSKADTHHKKQVKDAAQLQTNEKVALALFAPQNNHNAVTAKELLNHSYTKLQLGSPSETQVPIDTYHLEKIPAEYTGAPQDMVFYHAKESTGNYGTVIGVSNRQVLLSGTQGATAYQEIVNNGNLYDLNELNQKYGNESQLQQVANMIAISDSVQGTPSSSQAQTESSDNSSSESESSSSGETVTRANVIDKVEEYEGHALDTSTYTYKEPEQMGDGRWGFSILDKSGDLAGSYIVNSDGSVEKYDADGQRE